MTARCCAPDSSQDGVGPGFATPPAPSALRKDAMGAPTLPRPKDLRDDGASILVTGTPVLRFQTSRCRNPRRGVYFNRRSADPKLARFVMQCRYVTSGKCFESGIHEEVSVPHGPLSSEARRPMNGSSLDPFRPPAFVGRPADETVVRREVATQRFDGSIRRTAALSIGAGAPEFSLPRTPDEKVSLLAFRGRRVVLVFYPADWSPVCADQLALYNELHAEFAKFDAALLCVSVDGPWCHIAFAKDRQYRHLTLLSDFEPKGEVARQYGVYRDKDGWAERALFVIDRAGMVRWSYVSPVDINPGADGVLQALEALPTDA